MLKFVKDYLMFDMKLFGGFLYKITGKLDKFPILQAVVGSAYIMGMKFDMYIIDIIDRRIGA